jgi:metal-dependent HD superfamily phosphatase/phosphodiesterase
MLTLKDVRGNKQILEFINQTDESMKALSYTNHGLRHTGVVADRAMKIAKSIGLSEREVELAGIVGYCHDMGNFMSRTNHHYFAGLLFFQVFSGQFDEKEMAQIMQAIAEHDKPEMNFTTAIAAVLVIADKSDVDRSRVAQREMKDIRKDIHDRVNYATTESNLKVDKLKKRITLTLKIDTNFVPVMEYFEIFTERMAFCRTAAKFLGYDFGLIINKFRLL